MVASEDEIAGDIAWASGRPSSLARASGDDIDQLPAGLKTLRERTVALQALSRWELENYQAHDLILQAS